MTAAGKVQRVRARGARQIDLPADVAEILAHLAERMRHDVQEMQKRPPRDRSAPESHDEFCAYVAALFARGWPTRAIGEVCGMSRARAHVYALRHFEAHPGQEMVTAYPLPMPPLAGPAEVEREEPLRLPRAAERRLTYMASVANMNRRARTDGNPRVTAAVSREYDALLCLLFDAGFPIGYLASVTGQSQVALRRRRLAALHDPPEQIPGPWDLNTGSRARIARADRPRQQRPHGPRRPGIYRERLATMDTTKSATAAVVMLMMDNAGSSGLTWNQVADEFGWGHGTASGLLSRLHSEGRLARLVERRDGSSLYVTPAYVDGRATHAAKSNEPDQVARARVEAFITAAQSLATPPREIVVAGYSKRQGGPIRAVLSLDDLAAALRA